MKKIIFRLLSYGIDMLLISLVVSAFAIILPFCNEKKINTMSEDNLNETTEILEIIDSLNTDGTYMEDNKLSKEEFDNLSKKYDKKYDDFFEPYIDIELSEEEQTKMISDFSTKGMDIINRVYYEITKLNLPRSIINLVVVILYFGVLQFILKGQTLGKKLFKLYVVDSKDESNEVSLIKYIIRSLLITTCIFSIGSSLIATLVDFDKYMSINKYYSFIVQGYNLLLIMFIIFRNDQKGFHDLLLNTRVKMLNKDGSEYNKILFMDEEEIKVVEEEKETKKKITKKKKKNEKSTNKNN